VKARRPLAAATALFSLLAAAPAAAKFDPAHRWRTVETPHFAIRFHEGCDEPAARAASIAEEVHALLAPRVGWTPRARTQLIIADDDDSADGWATTYPYNQILITPTPPLGEPGFGTTRYDDWLRLVITHEYAHVLLLDMASRLPLALRSIFGRLYFPNALQPGWLIEGLATFEETELTAGGRGRSPGSEMFLRMAALEGRIPTLDEMAVFPDAWPAGQVPYLFGESFLRHIAGRFGREKVANIGQAYGGRPLPFLVESTGRMALGEEYRDLWLEWSTALRERFAGQERSVVSRGVTPSNGLTADGRFNGSPAWSPDGRRIAWLRADDREFPGIWIMDADGSNRERLVKSAFSTTSSGATLAWSRDGGRLYYTRRGFIRGAAAFNDVWAYDLGRRREIRVTRGLRARDPDPSPDGRTLALVTAERGLTRLALLDIDALLPAAEPSRLRPLTDPSAEQLAEPRWSPDGMRIAVSVRMPAGEKEIRILDREGRTLGRVGCDRALDGAPAWSPDGRRLFFSSDATGIFNLYAWDAATGEVVQITNVPGGAFTPSPSPDGLHVAFADYSARGYDIRVMRLEDRVTVNPEAQTPFLPLCQRGIEESSPAATHVADQPGGKLADQSGSFATPLDSGESAGRRGGAERGTPTGATGGSARGGAKRQDPAAPTGTSESLSSEPYSPLDTILPRLWLPWIASTPASGTLFGFITGGQDAVQRHRYTLTALYGPESDRLMYLADYAYDGLRPTLRLYASDFDRTYDDLLQDAGGAADYTERERTVGAEVRFDFPGLESSRAVALGYRYRDLSALTPLPPWDGYDGALPATGPLGSTRLAWAFSNAHLQDLSISPEDGRRVALGLERYQEGVGSECSFTRAVLDWSEYLPLPAPRHVLAARLFLGGAGGDVPPQGAFRLGGEAPGDIGYDLDDHSLPLRGYPPNTLRGERAVLAGLEYRFPLLDVGRGGVSLPFFLRRLHGALFVDAGEAWDDGAFSAGEMRAGVGAELRLDLYFSYFLPMTVHLGVAAGLDEGGGVYPTLGIRMPQGLLGSAMTTRRR